MNQRIERSSFLIPEEKVTPFINAILKSKVRHNIDEPGRNHPIAYIVIDDDTIGNIRFHEFLANECIFHMRHEGPVVNCREWESGDSLIEIKEP